MNGYDPERRDRDGDWGMHHVLYDDNDFNWYNFHKKEFRVVGRSGDRDVDGDGEAEGGVRPLRESLRGLGILSEGEQGRPRITYKTDTKEAGVTRWSCGCEEHRDVGDCAPHRGNSAIYISAIPCERHTKETLGGRAFDDG